MKMAIKFTGKDQPKAVPVATKAPVEKADRTAAAVAAKNGAPDGTDLFDPEPKAPATKRKSNGFRR
jgi:hypothetical protein